MLILAIKLFHTLVFFFLSACIVYILYCGITNRYSRKTTAAIVLIVFEGIVLVLNGWQCPLTSLAKVSGPHSPTSPACFFPTGWRIIFSAFARRYFSHPVRFF